MTRQFLEAGPQRVGSKYKKVMFVEYEDATFKKRKASDHLDKGILGPVIKGEVGDQFKVRERLLSAKREWNEKLQSVMLFLLIAVGLWLRSDISP